MEIFRTEIIYYLVAILIGFMTFINPKYISFLFYSKKVQIVFKIINCLSIIFLFVYGLISIDKDINSWSIYFGCLLLGYLLAVTISDKIFE